MRDGNNSDDPRIDQAQYMTWYPEALPGRLADGVAADAAFDDAQQDSADRLAALRRAALRAQR